MKRRTRPTMRTLLVVLLLLVAGAIVNVAVAWGCAYTIRFAAWSVGPEHFAGSLRWFADRRPHAMRIWFLADNSSESARANDLTGLPTWVPWPAKYPHREDDPNFWGWMELHDGFGWPCMAMKCAWSTQSDYLAMTTDGLAISPHQDLTRPGERDRALPIRPIWSGFAINTVFYAALLWGLFAAPFALRRKRRVKRGLCPACAYPIGASPVCTECGHRLPFPSR